MKHLEICRDIVTVSWARVGETYLIAAEVLIRQNQYNDALFYINKLRQRAAYKSGEDRSAYCDGGASYNENALGWKNDGVNSYYTENSYYESNNIAETTAATNLDITDIHNLPAEDEAIIAKLRLLFGLRPYDVPAAERTFS